MASAEWASLFTESAEVIWKSEQENVRQFAMLIHILGIEWTRLQTLATKELEKIRDQFKEIDSHNFKSENITNGKGCARKLSKALKPDGNNLLQIKKETHSLIGDDKKANKTKENIRSGITSLLTDNKQSIEESPDLFRCRTPDFTHNLIIQSSDDEIIVTQSPKIKKNKMLRQRKKREASILQAKRTLKDDPALKEKNELKRAKLNPSKQDLEEVKLINLQIKPNNREESKDSVNFKSLERIFRKPSQPKIPQCVNKTESEKKEQNNYQTAQMHGMNSHDKQISTQENVPMSCKDASQTILYAGSPELMNVDDILLMMNDDEGDKLLNSSNAHLDDFVLNYNKVPQKQIDETKQNKFCKLCYKKGAKCKRHDDATPKPLEDTYTGFWDIDFSASDDEGSEFSTIYN